MTKNIRNIFEEMVEELPPASLGERIKAGIMAERRRSAIWDLARAVLGLAFSLIFLTSVGIFWGENLMRSDFWNLIYLVFSDIKVVTAYWQDFVFSLLESLPVLPISVFLVSMILIAWFAGQCHMMYRRFEQFNGWKYKF